ncbi:MAG: SpoIIE family protein phosphatase [Lachnospiraceae bacterium]|nr:SpoIIE family protein phosphatase [Lachnospiraceae bacterium]
MHTNNRSIGRSLLVGCALSVLCICVLMGAVGFMTYYRGMIERYQVYLSDLLHTTALGIDGDDLARCIETGEKSENFEETQQILNRIKENYDIHYIYMVRPLNTEQTDNMMDVMAGITAQEKAENETFYSVTLGGLTGDYYTPKVAGNYLKGMQEDDVSFFSTDTMEFGRDYTGMLPIRDSAGQPVALLCVDISMNEIAQVWLRYVLTLIAAIILLSALAMTIMYSWLKKRVIQPVQRLKDVSEKIVSSSRGADDPQDLILADPEIHTGDEMESLAVALSDMFADMKLYMTDLLKVTKEKERIGAELNVATQIQADMLPRIFPPFPDRSEFDIYATMQPAKEVGGDFYDFFMLDEDHLGLVMADVSGKGVPAALFMVIAKTLIKNRAQMGGSPAEVLAYVNEQLCEGNDAELFVTVWFAILELSTGKGVAANAGHEHPVLRRSGGDYELVVYRHSPAVATLPGIRFREHEFELHPGDRVFVYTDGVPEAINEKEEDYGPDRMLAALNSCPPDTPMDETLRLVREDLDRFAGQMPQFDDVTMMAIDYRGPSEPDRL